MASWRHETMVCALCLSVFLFLYKHLSLCCVLLWFNAISYPHILQAYSMSTEPIKDCPVPMKQPWRILVNGWYQSTNNWRHIYQNEAKHDEIVSTLWSILWGVLCKKHVSGSGTSNYIQQFLWDIIACPYTWYLLLAQHPSIYRRQPWYRSMLFTWWPATTKHL